MFLTIQQHSLKHEYYRLTCLVCYVPPICDTLCSETDLMMMMMRVMVISWDLEIILLNVVWKKCPYFVHTVGVFIDETNTCTHKQSYPTEMQSLWVWTSVFANSCHHNLETLGKWRVMELISTHISEGEFFSVDFLLYVSVHVCILLKCTIY